MKVYHEKKSNGVRAHHEKDRWGWEFTIKKSDEVRVDHEKKTDGVRVDHEQVRWGESSPLEKAMG